MTISAPILRSKRPLSCTLPRGVVGPGWPVPQNGGCQCYRAMHLSTVIFLNSWIQTPKVIVNRLSRIVWGSIGSIVSLSSIVSMTDRYVTALRFTDDEIHENIEISKASYGGAVMELRFGCGQPFHDQSRPTPKMTAETMRTNKTTTKIRATTATRNNNHKNEEL